MDVKSFIKAARLRTLPLSVSGIIVGSYLGVAYLNSISTASVKIVVWLTPTFWLAILTTIGFQVLSNFANDYGDGVKGSDKNRTGEARMVSSGAITPRQMKTAMIITTIITLIIAILLIYVSFGSENFGYSILFFVLGIASITAAIKYTVGNSAYGYSGFGDVFVFIFFGLLSVVGSYFLFTKCINFQIFLPAISIGLLSTAVLNLNNLRDREEDKKNNKNTLVVKLGTEKAKKYHYFLIFGALISALIFVFLNFESVYQFVFLMAFIPLIKNVKTVAENKIPAELDKELKKVALSTFLFAILFGITNTFF
ncbi:1,4-dihydroxy-2-naphthoate octaprenyltransferase [Polaribacter reichenbachii]|uniref:1,4-dihydroxy-2-naphthoate octaprenyltransferase n=1 Tax=Polaribacter reichenbachii TaxID=996801 RepID=A0A1B8U4G0_9FLAO|nr:1,4-dihydroxy-2-naphthoate octaprenyltransferase [Polaribacter reichenbachii]APZ47510.1 1,4-dihydroxy-2-naphthoate octaprenyltransferase [Polaribacter reichenbachii]AUC18149.1 1,4-dihydroxy-2-naphthoate octaprenyltransferase [Polaribacter reichenbachii]OBY66760.1 1,4-dihydroxy-2-naphthoate octaprenyltransferase [Polaribacter reichenbachii]